MLTGLILASVMGALALPDFARLADAMGMGGEDDDGANVPDDGSDNVEAADSPDSIGDAMMFEQDVVIDDAPDDLPTESAEDLSIMEIQAVPGVMEIGDFDPETQEIALNVPENTTGYLTSPADPNADPPVPAMLTFEVPDGAVEMRFIDMDAVPVEAISLSAAGGDAVGIESLLLNDDPGLLPDDPETVSEAGEPTEDGILPDDPEAPALAAGDVTDEPILPDDPEGAEGPLAAPQQVTGFDPETDVLQIEGSADAALDVLPSIDGSDSEVFVDDALVAVIVGVPDATVDVIQMVPVPI